MIKKIVVLGIISILLIVNFTTFTCLSKQVMSTNFSEINTSDQDKGYSISESYQQNPPLPPVMWTEDFSIFYIPTPQNPDGDDVYYFINWGDGTSSDWIGPFASGETAIISHDWSEDGTYDLKVKAKDPDGESKWAFYILTLSTDFKFFGVSMGYIEMTYIFTIYWNNGSYCFIMVDWGDGNYEDWMGPYEQPLLFSHSWDLPGEYVIKLKMKDIWGNENDWLTFTVTILNYENSAPNKPNITGKWIVVFVVLECNFSSTDPDEDDVRYHIDWDDGEIDITDYYKSGEKVSVRHIFSEQGDFKITAYAEDIHGAIGPENTFNPRSKTKAVNVNLFFLQSLKMLPLLSRVASLIL